MEIIAIFAVILLALNTVCVGLDKLLLHKDKPKIYTLLLNWWLYIDTLDVPDLYRESLFRIYRFKTWLLGAKRNWFRAILLAIAISFLMTTSMISLSAAMIHGLDIIPKILLDFAINEEGWMAYGANFLFDIISMSITVFLLSAAYQGLLNDKYAKSILILITDAVFAITVSLMCILFIVEVTKLKDIIHPVPTILFNTLFFKWDELLKGNDLIAGFYGLTTLLPTLILLTFLLVFFLSKPVVYLSKHGALYFIERLTQDDPSNNESGNKFQPFTLLGVLVSLVAVIPTLIISIYKILDGKI